MKTKLDRWLWVGFVIVLAGFLFVIGYFVLHHQNDDHVDDSNVGTMTPSTVNSSGFLGLQQQYVAMHKKVLNDRKLAEAGDLDRNSFQTERNYMMLNQPSNFTPQALVAFANRYHLKNPGEPKGDWQVQWAYDQKLMHQGYLKFLDVQQAYQRRVMSDHNGSISYTAMRLHLSRRQWIELLAIEVLTDQPDDSLTTGLDLGNYHYDQFKNLAELMPALNQYVKPTKTFTNWQDQYQYDQIQLALTYLKALPKQSKVKMQTALACWNFDDGNFTKFQFDQAWALYQKVR